MQSQQQGVEDDIIATGPDSQIDLLQLVRGQPRGECSASAAGLKRNRAVATRYDKLAVRYEATVTIAAISEWL